MAKRFMYGRVIIAAALLVAHPPAGDAQTRFELLSKETLAPIKGVSVYTIRDNKAGRCYSLFVLDPDGAPLDAQAPSSVPTTDQMAKARLAQSLKDAGGIRDQKMTDLRQRVGSMWTAEYEAARERIEQEYERTVVALLPDTYPATQVAPGFRTMPRERLDEAVRRAIADSDGAAATQARSAVDERTLALLERLDRRASVTVSGPAPCQPDPK